MAWARSLRRRLGFTIVELLVVVATIAALVALISPALDGAMGAASRLKCLSNERTRAVGAIQYAWEHKRLLPPNTMDGQGRASAYDMRSPWDNTFPGSNAFPMATGLLVMAHLLPVAQLGKAVHCPIFDNLGNPSASGHNMDVAHPWGFGASWWENPAASGQRIINGYLYRAASWSWVHGRNLRLTDVSGRFILTSDILDRLVAGPHRAYAHPEGYGLGFGDASGHFFSDPDFKAENYLLTVTGGHGRVGGDWSSASDEEMFEYLSVQH